MFATFKTIEMTADDDGVATITLNRPERLNAFTETMATELAEAWRFVREGDGIRAVVLRANGDRAFCTGIDMKEGPWWTDRNVWNQVDPGTALGPKQNKVWKPVIAAVHGMCAGGGQLLVDEADIVICSDDATFFDAHANSGLVAALEPIGMLRRGVPLGDVLRWALMGTEERISAASALRLGLVSEVVERSLLRSRARDIAAGIARRRPEAVQGSVRAIWESLDMTRSLALQNGLAYTHIGNPRPGADLTGYSLERDPEIR